MRDIDPADMLLFAAVVRAGGFTQAGRELGISKQAVSDRVGRLERALGARLLERTTRSVRVTEAGKAYAARCAQLALLVDEANREARDRLGEPAGVLRVSAPVAFGQHHLGALATDLVRVHPALRLEVLLSDRRAHLIEEGIDVAIRVGPLGDSSLVARRIGEVREYLVASPAYLSEAGPIRGAADLRRARTIAVRPGERWTIGGRAIAIAPALLITDHAAAREAAIEGLGVARLPGPLCEAALAAGRLVRLLGGRAVGRQPIHAVYASRHSATPAVRALVTALAARLGA